MGLRVTEKDGAGRDSAVYSVAVTHLANGNGETTPSFRARGNVKIEGNRPAVHRAQLLRGIFLPAGYPASVSPDYLCCQVYYGLQAFCSSLAGLIANRAVLEGHGIGKAEASATDAMLLTVLQDAFTRLTTILAAYFLGTSLFPEAKTYRLVADIANDISIFFDLLSPQMSPFSASFFFPFIVRQPGTGLRLAALCLSGAFRALCGVTAGGARAALTLHFAQDGEVPGDVGDLSAKDSSKETVLALIGMLCGSLLMPHLQSAWSTYTVVLLLLSCHLLANYLAVRAVVMRSLNRQRASILWSAYRQNLQVLNPNQVAQIEYTFGRANILYHTDKSPGVIVGRGAIGIPFSEVFAPKSSSWLGFWRRDSHVTTGGNAAHLPRLLELFTKEKFILWAEATHTWVGQSTPRIQVFLKEGHTARDHLKAWVHAADLATLYRPNAHEATSIEILRRIEDSKQQVDSCFDAFVEGLKNAGWDTEAPGLVSGSPVTIHVEDAVDGEENRKEV